MSFIWGKVFKGGLNKFCGRQPLKNLKGCGLLFSSTFQKSNCLWERAQTDTLFLGY